MLFIIVVLFVHSNMSDIPSPMSGLGDDDPFDPFGPQTLFDFVFDNIETYFAGIWEVWTTIDGQRIPPEMRYDASGNPVGWYEFCELNPGLVSEWWLTNNHPRIPEVAIQFFDDEM